MSSHAEATPSEPDNRQWYVRMVAGGAVFGPIRTQGLVLGAAEGRVMPDDEVSEDKVHWRAAQEIPELCMDTLIAHPNGSFIGPFHRDALQALIREGKIPPDSKPFPKSELGQRLAARQMTLFGEESPESDAAERPRRRKSAETAPGADSAEADRLRQELETAQGELEEVRSALARTEKELDKAVKARDAALAERDAARKERDAEASNRNAAVKARDAALAERDEARGTVEELEKKLAVSGTEVESRTAALRGQVEAASMQLAEALAARDAASSERDAAKAARDASIAARDAAVSDRDAAVAARDAAVSDRDAAIAARDAAVSDRDAAIAARNAAVSDRDAALSARDAAVSDRDAAIAARDAAVSDRDAAVAESKAAEERTIAAEAAMVAARADAESARAEAEVVRADVEAIRAREESLRSEHAELLDFSNARDAESKATIVDLEQRICDLRDRLAQAEPSPENESELRGRLQERENEILCLAKQLATVSEASKEREAVLLKRIEDLETGCGSLPI